MTSPPPSDADRLLAEQVEKAYRDIAEGRVGPEMTAAELTAWLEAWAAAKESK